MRCPLCNDTGDQRYWEARWRDEKAENERLLAALTEIATAEYSPASERLTSEQPAMIWQLVAREALAR